MLRYLALFRKSSGNLTKMSLVVFSSMPALKYKCNFTFPSYYLRGKFELCSACDVVALPLSPSEQDLSVLPSALTHITSDVQFHRGFLFLDFEVSCQHQHGGLGNVLGQSSTLSTFTVESVVWSEVDQRRSKVTSLALSFL